MSATQLAVHEAGNPSGSPVLMIHGFLSSRHQWDLNVDRLGAELRLIMVEVPGHGDSPAPHEPAAYEPAGLIAALEEVRRERAIDRWWVIGQSFGGAFATRYALTHADRTLGLVITNSRATFGVGSEGGEPTGIPSDLRRMPFHPIHAKRFPADLKQRMVEVADRIPHHAVDYLARSARGWRSGDQLGELTMPTLLVNGVWEKNFQPNADQVREHHPEIEIVDLDGGHSINVEQAEAFDRAVLDFIGRHSG